MYNIRRKKISDSLCFFNGKEIYELDWDNESIVETICLLKKS